MKRLGEAGLVAPTDILPRLLGVPICSRWFDRIRDERPGYKTRLGTAILQKPADVYLLPTRLLAVAPPMF